MAVYASSSSANRQEVLQSGAYAAVVDTSTGQARQLATDVALNYFSPACGPGDEVVLTRSIGADEQQTDLLRVDAITGRITKSIRVKAQVTAPVVASGELHAMRGPALVRVADSGALSEVARTGGRPLSTSATASGAIDLLTVHGDRTVAHRLGNGQLTRLGDAPVGRLQLFPLRGGRNALVGAVQGIARTPDLIGMDGDRPVAAVSGDGHLVATELVADRTVALHTSATAPPDSSDIRVSVQATSSRQHSSGTFRVTSAPRLDVTLQPARPVPGAAGERVDPPTSISTPTCAVLRNDLKRQVLQPTAPMVEWAVNQAVKGQLTVQRPANYLKSGLPAYTPQGLFPLPPLVGGGQVPAQVFLAVLAQESNFRQATWHARPGDGGNPLVGDYYGNKDVPTFIHYQDADCGYGISQMTDGMRVGQTKFTAVQQAAIGIDYAANIAAGLQTLVHKWNELANAGMVPNNGGAAYVENWFLAVWTYNSGFYPQGSGHWGVGWFNNPANPRYPADRVLFLRASYADAEKPSKWPYPEKIMGWAERPQLTYFGKPSYPKPRLGMSGPNPAIADPVHTQFCAPNVNNCDPNNLVNPCPAESSACWWYGKPNWTDCERHCATEVLTYGAGSAEPAMTPQYQPNCAPLGPPGTIVVDDIPDSSVNVRGCAGAPRGGKFVLRTGGGLSPTAYFSQIDLHSFGAGYMGHMWFTHSRDSAKDPGNIPINRPFEVVGAWTPDLPYAPKGKKYKIRAHVPTHGADERVTYVINLGVDDKATHQGQRSVTFEQRANGTNSWLDLGEFTLYTGANVVLSNLVAGANGTADVAFDALAFEPV